MSQHWSYSYKLIPWSYVTSKLMYSWSSLIKYVFVVSFSSPLFYSNRFNNAISDHNSLATMNALFVYAKLLSLQHKKFRMLSSLKRLWWLRVRYESMAMIHPFSLLKFPFFWLTTWNCIGNPTWDFSLSLRYQNIIIS